MNTKQETELNLMHAEMSAIKRDRDDVQKELQGVIDRQAYQLMFLKMIATYIACVTFFTACAFNRLPHSVFAISIVAMTVLMLSFWNEIRFEYRLRMKYVVHVKKFFWE